jgi:integrase
MPKKQVGSVVKRSKRNYGVRWYSGKRDEKGKLVRHYQGGFETQSAAEAWLRTKVDEVLALRRGDLPHPDVLPTVNQLVDGFLASHDVDPATTNKLKYELAHAKRQFGTLRIDELRPLDLAAWRATLPPRTRHQPFGSFKQVLEQAVALGLLQSNPCARIKNKRARLDEDREIRPFESWDEVEAIADELPEHYRAIPVVLVGTGLRPEELYGLERRDLDRKAGVLSVERVYSQGRLKPCMKSSRQRRRVPLRAKVLEALDSMPARIDTPVLFPTSDGGRIRHATFRLRHWAPALRAAGLEHRGVYATRHTFAAWSLRAGVHLYYLSRIMGTSVAQIDKTYGHLVPDSEEYLRDLLDAYDSARPAEGAR